MEPVIRLLENGANVPEFQHIWKDSSWKSGEIIYYTFLCGHFVISVEIGLGVDNTLSSETSQITATLGPTLESCYRHVRELAKAKSGQVLLLNGIVTCQPDV